MASAKIYLIFGCVLAFVFGSMLASALHFKGAYEKCKAHNNTLKSLIENQNQAIKQLEIDTEHYTATIALQEQKLKARYKNLKSDKDLQSCEAKLSEISKAFEIFEKGIL